jgi:hypothetical protein
MKSPMVMNSKYITKKDKARYSDLQVLKSPAGYYVGTMYETGQPGTRDSEYMKTEAEAKILLATLDQVGFEAAAKILRKNP